ncbi:SagB/ThcOx family dehydrogenase [Rheinheimera riviphila]|uniref:SagB/ThcOx family dehydrogenase n=1 Tax=Rheinheimera riviphila TaxID=1834037 RepID=A0A437R5H1_9GAMM|nr:SagB/ThcOx family dehydrogenase [Rheinheimera riviphila]RVU41961.1 SagB/ThcOx family dehydrogenase [Rheinheimera riviphila]
MSNAEVVNNAACQITALNKNDHLLRQLSSEHRAVIDVYVQRALARQQEELPVTPLSLAHDGLKLDPEMGKQVMNNILFSDRPGYTESSPSEQFIALPPPQEASAESYAALLKRRKSLRDYTDAPISLAELSSICHLAAGVKNRFKTNSNQTIPYAPFTPTGGGLLSMHLYYAALNTEGLSRGIYRYRAEKHAMQVVSLGEIRGRIFEIASFQDWIARSAGIFILVSDLDRVQWKYEDRAYRLTHMDAGVLGQSVHLTATSLNLGSCMVFGFLDDEMNQLLGIDGDRQFVSLIIPVGHPITDYSAV